jgi:hypothetical protein
MGSRLRTATVETGGAQCSANRKKETTMTKLAWIVSAIKLFPAVLLSITKYPSDVCALTMFIIALARVLR